MGGFGIDWYILFVLCTMDHNLRTTVADFVGFLEKNRKRNMVGEFAKECSSLSLVYLPF